MWTGLGDRVLAASACRQPQCRAQRPELWVCLAAGCGYVACGRAAKGPNPDTFLQKLSPRWFLTRDVHAEGDGVDISDLKAAVAAIDPGRLESLAKS